MRISRPHAQMAMRTLEIAFIQNHWTSATKTVVMLMSTRHIFSITFMRWLLAAVVSKNHQEVLHQQSSISSNTLQSEHHNRSTDKFSTVLTNESNNSSPDPALQMTANDVSIHSEISLDLELPQGLDTLTDHSIPIPIEHDDMQESTTILLAGEVLGNETLEHQLEIHDDHEGDTLTHKDIEILRNVTSNVGDFDPLTHERPERFIPVLEARGIDDNDKDEFGHRRDTMPIANAVDAETSMKTHSAVFQFLEEFDLDGNKIESAIKSNRILKKYLKTHAQGIIVRNNPGTLGPVSQKKCDDMLRELSDEGLMIMTHPDVASTLGAKDSLVKIKHLKCGLEDTYVYYNPEDFIQGFRKTIAFQPRVIKQNRGSQGEGIWIVKLKDETAYCKNYGDHSVSLDTEIVLMEAWDNHVEYHTVEEFIEFCVNGRTKKSGKWESTGIGKYFEGGIEAGSMIVDQRFLPRIVEGEVRCLFVGSELVEIVHKKPANGGLSATLASGAKYMKYEPDDPKFSRLVEQLRQDVPRIMDSFDMAHRPLPLLWTADYIYGDTDDQLYVGEINCSCPGITQQLDIVPIIAKVALETVFPEPEPSDSEPDDLLDGQ